MLHCGASVLPITSRHQTISSQFSYVQVQFVRGGKCLDMQKRPARTELIEGSLCKKCTITMKTVDKWIAENDKALNMTMWLHYDRKIVSM